jgi:hypothetical protein
MRVRISSALLVFVLLLSGCRTYGDYGSQEAMYRQIHVALDQLDAEASAFDARRSAIAVPAMTDALDRLAASRSHLVGQYREIVSQLSESSGHRELRRVYGALISDRQIIYDRLARLEAVAADVDGAPLRLSDPRSDYQTVPLYYYRVGAMESRRSGVADTAAVSLDVPGDDVAEDDLPAVNAHDDVDTDE